MMSYKNKIYRDVIREEKKKTTRLIVAAVLVSIIMLTTAYFFGHKTAAQMQFSYHKVNQEQTVEARLAGF